RPPGAPMTGATFTEAVRTLETQEAIQVRDGARYFTLFQPIENQERCQGCHGTDHKVRAVMRVATSMEPVFAEVAAQEREQAAMAARSAPAAGAVVGGGWGRLVVRPIRQLAAGARRIGEGDFAARAPVRSRDEVGELGAAFNDMTGRLATAHHALEDK